MTPVEAAQPASICSHAENGDLIGSLILLLERQRGDVDDAGTAVGGDDRPVDDRRLVGGQEQADRRDLIGGRRSPERDPAGGGEVGLFRSRECRYRAGSAGTINARGAGAAARSCHSDQPNLQR
jgi:hypothetical protein